MLLLPEQLRQFTDWPKLIQWELDRNPHDRPASFRAWSDRDPAAASAWLVGLTDSSPVIDQMRSTFGAKLSRHDTVGALAWVRSVEDPQMRESGSAKSSPTGRKSNRGAPSHGQRKISAGAKRKLGPSSDTK